MSTKVITQEVTLSFPHLAEATQAQNGKGNPKFSGSLVYDAGANLDAEKAALTEAATKQWGDKAALMLKTGQVTWPIRTDWEAKGYPEGSSFINARSEAQPGLVYPHKDPATGKPALVIPGVANPDYVLTDADKKTIGRVFYAGKRVRAAIVAFAYEYRETANGPVMKRGVSFGLNNIQALGDGPRLDGRKAAQDEFEPTTELVPANLDDLGV
jgi:hypothetical protein